MDYPIKTLAQLRPILQGFRKAAGLTQAAMASHLGVTQQTYAQLEANPAAVSVDRLFRVLRVLGVDLTLIPNAAGSTESDPTADDIASPAPLAQPARKAAAIGSAKKATARTGRTPRNQPATPAPTATRISKTKAASREGRDNAAAKPSRVAPQSRNSTRKREDW